MGFSRLRVLFLCFAVLLPALVAFAILYRQALFVPYQDDYGAILNFALSYAQSAGVKAKIFMIATLQYNEYKLGFEHSIVAAEMEFTHHLDFPFLVTLGDLFLLPIAYLLWRTFQNDDKLAESRLFRFLPVSLLFFSLTYWENLNWAMSGLANIPVIFFSFLALYLLTRGGTRLPWVHLLPACLAAVLATSSLANGFLLAPVGLLILLPRRAYAQALTWCASFAIPLAAYLYQHQSSSETVYQAAYLHRTLSFFCFFASVFSTRWPAVLLGTAILATFALSIYSRFDRSNPAIFFFAVWIVATGSLVAWVRGAAAWSVNPRYSLYSILMLIFCYYFLAWRVPSRLSGLNRRRFYTASIVITALICLRADVRAYKKLEARRQMVISGIRFYRAQPGVNSPMIDPLVEESFPREKALERLILTRAIQKHVYTLPPEGDVR